MLNNLYSYLINIQIEANGKGKNKLAYLRLLNSMLNDNKTSKKEFGGFTIKEVNLEPRTYIGTRDTVKWADMQSFFATSYPKLFGTIAKAEIEMKHIINTFFPSNNKIINHHILYTVHVHIITLYILGRTVL